MKKYTLLLLSVLVLQLSKAQVGINILHPDSSAVLQLESNKKGLGLSRLSTTQRDAIQNPLRGLMIYNVTDSFVEYWTGSCWLRAYEKNCNECDFSFNIDDATDTLDRVVDDSVYSILTVQKFKSTHPINVFYFAMPPTGVNIFLDGPTTIDTSGTIKIVVKADIFAGDGNVPIVLQAFCGDEVHFLTYNVYIEPCVRVSIPIDVNSYNLQAANSTQLPAGSKKCVVLTVNNSVEVGSDTSIIPAYQTGNLHPQSKVGIVNNGAILGKGGCGGGFPYTGSTVTPGGNPGIAGGDAMQLTTRTILINNGAIYGGGGGGGSVGLVIQTPSLPIVGNITIGAGFGGGGGSESGCGGTTPSNGLNIGIFRPGQAATAGLASVPGIGGTATTTIPITISIVTVNLSPTAWGGTGGGYGQAGNPGYVDLQIQVCVQVPIIGSVCIPIPLGGLVPVYGPAGGGAGMAVKRNGNSLTNLPDGNYNSNQVKGLVGP